ncbi:MAG: hypothetical protein IPH04_14130 [Saprospirales bacterium]|nr:hypothetical protein [Saprospirales bacterium]
MLIDSGTTLYHLFQRLGEAFVDAKYREEPWINNLKIVTNNLPGVDSLMEIGRTNPKDRYSPLAIDCMVLPGNPLPVYSATLGKATIKNLEGLKGQSNSEKDIFIGLTTGNWVRIRRTNPTCPLALARGDGHLEFKQALKSSWMKCVVAPLPKIFVYTPLDKINKAWGFNDSDLDPDKRNMKNSKFQTKKQKL